jgi:hypothetical protein
MDTKGKSMDIINEVPSDYLKPVYKTFGKQFCYLNI